MRIGLLGPLRVETGEGPVRIHAAKERAVLATLALAAGRTVTMSQLVDALWGDDPPPTAVKTAQAYVARLRRVLPTGWITSDGSGYVLTVDPADVDVVAFENALDDARGARQRGDHASAAHALSVALALWRGNPVPDLIDHPRGQAADARLTDLRLTAQEDWADARLALGAGAELVADLDAAARAEPLRERRWGQLMVALYRAGRQGEALRAYQRARDALIDGLGIEPGDGLQAVERAVLERDPALMGVSAASSPLPAALTTITATTFAGRDEELAAIDERWQTVCAGGRRAVIVDGEPGIGKTRLVAEAACNLQRGGALVLFGRCDRDGLTPYQAVVDALRTHVRTVGTRDAIAVSDVEVRELARLLPDLGPRRDDDPGVALDDRAGRQRLFDAVASYVDLVAGQARLVLVIDDLQWIDPEGAALIRHLLRSLRAPLLLLATHRSDDEGADVALAQFVAQLPVEVDPTTIELGGLDATGIRELIGDDAPDLVAAINDATGGSPLFITELLRFRSVTGRLPEGDEVPAGVRNAVVRRIADLPGHARRLLDAVAVAGEGVALAEVAAAAGLSEHDAVEVADRAIAAHVLVDQPASSAGLRFTHDLVRAAVSHDITATRRAYLHRRLAEAILTATDGDPGGRAAAVAHHLAAAAEERDPLVARWAVEAAEHALGQYAWDAAASQFELALENTSDEPTPERVELLVRLAEAHRAAGMESPAKQRFAEAVATARALDDPAVLRNVVVRWTVVPVDIRRELRDVIALLRDTLASTPDDRSPQQAQLMARLAFSLGWAAEPDARATAEAALAIARSSGDPIVLARALVYAVPTRDQFEAYDPAGLAGELREVVSRVDDPPLRCQALSAWITGNLQRANRTEAERSLAELRVVADRYRILTATLDAMKVEGQLALVDGDMETAESIVDELLRNAARTDLPNLFLLSSSLLYDVRRAQGRLAELLPWFERRESTGERVPKVAAMRAEVLLAAGRDDAAAKALREFVDGDFASISPAERPHSIATLADVAVQLVDRDAASRLADVMAPWSGLVVYDSTNGPLVPVDAYLGRLATIVR